ncbi:hypothetical protein BB561_006593 [Smittium simulii]|uniref:Uncharacterized protein n=1 Tax=Smittium simulii TaxID=133385 RepID=A0A2T9Y2Z4_9FUNG|nr:hypothetical protein BB561_006593 [Smittium simulii]
MAKTTFKKEKALNAKLKEERQSKMETDITKPTPLKKLLTPKGKPKGAKNTIKGNKGSGSTNPRNHFTDYTYLDLINVNNKFVPILDINTKEDYRNQLTDFTDYTKKTLQKKRIKPAQIDEYIFKINQKFLDYSEKQIEKRTSKTLNNIKKIMDNGKVRIINSDKNLGPVAVYTTYYHKQVLKILGNTNNYKEIYSEKKDIIKQVKLATFPLQNHFFMGMKWGFKPNLHL